MTPTTHRPARAWARAAVLSSLLLVAGAAASAEAPHPDMTKAVAARLKHDTALCKSHVLDACNDAIRRNPSDPVLLTAHADTLMRVNRTADALKQYRRAAALSPNQKGLTAKIAAAEKRLQPKRAIVAVHGHGKPRQGSGEASRVASTATEAKGDHFSNAAPETQSH